MMHQSDDIVDAALGSVTPNTRQRLLRAALEAFATKGFHASTTRDIAKRAGMSSAAVYVHYESKGQLLHWLSTLAHETVLGMVEDVIRTTDDPISQLTGYAHAMTLFHARNATIARISQYELQALGPAEFAEIAALRRRTTAILYGIIDRGVEAGDFKVTKRATTTRAILSLCIDVARWYNPDRADSPEDLARHYAQLALHIVGVGDFVPDHPSRVASGRRKSRSVASAND